MNLPNWDHITVLVEHYYLSWTLRKLFSFYSCSTPVSSPYEAKLSSSKETLAITYFEHLRGKWCSSERGLGEVREVSAVALNLNNLSNFSVSDRLAILLSENVIFTIKRGHCIYYCSSNNKSKLERVCPLMGK